MEDCGVLVMRKKKGKRGEGGGKKMRGRGGKMEGLRFGEGVGVVEGGEIVD